MTESQVPELIEGIKMQRVKLLHSYRHYVAPQNNQQIRELIEASPAYFMSVSTTVSCSIYFQKG